MRAAWITPVPPFFIVISLTFALLNAYAQPASDEETKTQELAKDFGIGPNDATQWILTFSR